MKSLQSGPLVATQNKAPAQVLKELDLAIKTIETPTQAKAATGFVDGLLKAFKAGGATFEQLFALSERFIDIERRQHALLSSQSGLRGIEDIELAKKLSMTKGTLHTLRFDLKKAYDKPEEDIKALKEKAKKLKKILTRDWFKKSGSQSQFSKYPEYYTPAWIYERARLVMGSIDLDPATSQEALKQNKATSYFTKEDDGLKQEWPHNLNIFCNPPFSLSDNSSGAEAFLKKILDTRYKACVFVTIEDSGTSYGQFLLKLCSAYFIQKGRVAFSGLKGNTRSSIVWGLNVDILKFDLAFKLYGTVITRHKSDGQLWTELQERQKELTPWVKKLRELPKGPDNAMVKIPSSLRTP